MRIPNSAGIRTEHRGSLLCTDSGGNGDTVERVVNIDADSLRGRPAA